MTNSIFSGFYNKSLAERIDVLTSHHLLSSTESEGLRKGKQVLSPTQADRMIENVIGVFGLPIGLGVNLKVNGKEYAVPMAVEEPSIVAAVSSAAKLTLDSGGIDTSSDDPILIGQIVIDDVPDMAAASDALKQKKEDILNLANSLHPNMVARGGGAKDLRIRVRDDVADASLLVVHLMVDTRDAMGANLVNSICEGVSTLIEMITGGKVLLRILSNLSDQSLVRARLAIPAKMLAKNGFTGEQVRDRIISAGRFAEIDYHRAVTHNKGIMNGIDAVAIATGNDWRSIEAAAHAYAASNHQYSALTRWRKDESGQLVGYLEMPLNVGIVGGSIESNPAAKMALQILEVTSARELSEVMAAVGLLQNLAALRALVTEGIQKGHMTLHARSVAQAAGASADIADDVVDRLIASGDIKVWKARQIVDELNQRKRQPDTIHSVDRPKREFPQMVSAPGKVVLFGEHAVLYGSRAIAVPLPKKIYARVLEDSLGVHLIVPRWGIDTTWVPNSQYQHSTLRAIERILTKIGVTRPKIRIELFPEIPRAMGLGSSAAAAVALIRAISNYYSLALSDEEVNRIAYESENIVHGSSSGIDNTVATFNQPLLYEKDLPSLRAPIRVPSPIPMVVGLSNNASLTAPMVARVKAAWQKDRRRYDSIFNAIDQRVGQALEALQQNDLQQLGGIMNENHKLLKHLNVSDPTLDRMVATALEHGAVGAKLTGGGGGGAVIALCPENSEAVAGALNDSGFETFHMTVGSTANESGSDRSTTSVATAEQRLVTVDDNDTATGQCTREECHAGEGILHRAFSIFIFDGKGRVLLQKRSTQKTLWPLFWSNSVCSHPRVGESTHAAAQRRLTEELGISTPLSFLFKFSYQARYGDAGSENELCSVFIGRTDDTIQADPQEIEQWRFVSIQALEEELASSPERFTPWFKIEWQRLRQHPMVKAYQKETAPA